MKLRDIVARLRGQTTTVTFVDDKGVRTVRTFDELHGDVLGVLERLKACGVRAGCRVGIAAPSQYAWMVWDLACLAHGCVSVAFPNEAPSQPLDELVDAHALTLLAVDAAWLGEHAAHGERVVDIDPGVPSSEAAWVEPVVHDHDDIVHSLVFSSGTTGKTKGLIISRPGTEKLLTLYHEAFGVAPGERFLTFLPLANYQQRMIYYFCLYHRVDFVSVPFALLFAGLKEHAPTFVIAPPVLYETLQSLTRASVGAAASADPGALSRRLNEITGGRIRYMITGMAPIKRAALDFFWDCGIALYEAFGITEAGMVAWNKPGALRVGTVGKPAEPGSVSLTDEGEVIITRDHLLSIGYFESSDEDAQSTFIGQNSVATGDIGAFDDDGFLRVIGRKKDAIITRNGEKFHPEPIELQIHRDARVGVAVVLPCERAGLSAVISTKHHGDPEAVQALRAHVAAVNQALSAQQQVRHLVFTDRDFTVENGFRTRNLKLNRKAIAAAFLVGS